MSQRDVVGEHAPAEKDKLVEMNRAATLEHPAHVQSVSDGIKDKHEQTDSSKQIDYLAIFQWILLIFCVLSNIYLLSKPEIKCECDGFFADNLIINGSSLDPTTSPQIIPSSLFTTSFQPSSQPTTAPTLAPASRHTSSPSKHPTTGEPTVAPSTYPSQSPTINPSFHPTLAPTSRPTSSPSKYPTVPPTAYPSQSPTYFDGHFIADYKYSFRNSSHGFWVLCHGQWLPITQYSMLYDEIGYQFGHSYDSANDISSFRLPDARDGVIGVIGSVHQMNEVVGNETHVLSESEIPEHVHLYGGTDTGCDGATGSNLAHRCSDGEHDYSYALKSSTTDPSRWKTSDVGGNQSFSVMQPTKFIGNLFMYSGIMH